DGEGDVTADIVYSNTRTYWVDPITGSPLDLREEQRRVAVVDGEERLVMFDATMDFTDETVAERVAAAADGDKIILIRTTLPIVLLAVGAVVLVIGRALALSRPRTPAHARACRAVDERPRVPPAPGTRDSPVATSRATRRGLGRPARGPSSAVDQEPPRRSGTRARRGTGLCGSRGRHPAGLPPVLCGGERHLPAQRHR